MRNLGLRLIHVHTASISASARLPDTRGTWTNTRSRRLTTSPKCSAGRATTHADVSSNCSLRSTKNQQDRSRTRERLDSSGCSEAISMLVIRLRQAASQASRGRALRTASDLVSPAPGTPRQRTMGNSASGWRSLFGSRRGGRSDHFPVSRAEWRICCLSHHLCDARLHSTRTAPPAGEVPSRLEGCPSGSPHG